MLAAIVVNWSPAILIADRYPLLSAPNGLEMSRPASQEQYRTEWLTPAVQRLTLEQCSCLERDARPMV